MTANIYIVGLGTMNIDHITRQVERAISMSEEVLFLDDGIATRAFLEARCERVTDLSGHFAAGKNRIESHHHLAAEVIEAAMARTPVTLAIAGHPTHLAPATFLVADLAGLLGLRVEILAGISAMDQLFVELAIDPASHGLQCFEATDLLLRRRPVAVDVPLLLWQVGLVGTHNHTSSPRPPETFEGLTRYLLRFYPPNHEVIAAEAASHALLEPVHLAFPLSTMPAHAAQLTARTTLYVSPIGIRPIVDSEVLAELRS